MSQLSVVAVLLLFLNPVICQPCPSICRCAHSAAGALTVDCSGRMITDLEPLLSTIHPNTSILDLRRNKLTVIRAQSFSSNGNISVLLMDDNQITDIEAHAFKGMYNIRLLSLTGNRLNIIRGNSFSELSGDETLCSGQSAAVNDECLIDLRDNEVSTVERHAFAWTKRLQVMIGGGQRALSVDAYAFYGARWMRRFRVSNVPRLTLVPRLFTNAEHVRLVEVADTTLDSLDKFVFEGLKDVDEIVFRNVSVGVIQSFAFSGLQFRKNSDTSGTDGKNKPVDDAKTTTRAAHRQARYAQSGGELNLVGCHIGVLSTDAFRDANVAHINIKRTSIDEMQAHAFRGVSGLQSLVFVDSRLDAQGRLRRESLASLRGLRRLHVDYSDLTAVESFAFRDVVDIDSVRIRFRSPNATLMTESFAHVIDVDELELSGRPLTGVTSLTVDVGAFRNLVGVERLHLADFRLPVVRRHSFGGLSRVVNLTIERCDVSGIEREAFVDAQGHIGGAAVGLLDMSVGNQLNCDCFGQNSALSLQRELEQSFVDYRVTCRLNMSPTYLDVRQASSRHVVCSDTSTIMTSTSLLTICLLTVIMLTLR